MSSISIPARVLKPWQLSLLIVLVGLASGALTAVGQGLLPQSWNTLVNSGAIWLLVAFLVSAWAPSSIWAVVAGVGTLFAEVLGYFGSISLMLGYDIPLLGTALWLAVALVGGPVYGLAGRWWRTGSPRQQAIALALMGGVFVAEGTIALIWLEQGKEASRWIEVTVGILIPLLFGRSWQARLLGLGLLVVLVPLGLLVFQFINAFFRF
jgi:Family of unknown function (DUF6518)